MAQSKPTLADAGFLILRISGAFFAVHGWGKVHTGLTGSTWGFVESVRGLGFPAPFLFAWLAALSELVGGIAVTLGIYTRVAAFTGAVTMFVAAFMAHADDAFAEKEMALLYLAIFLGLTFTGGGKLTIDSFWRKG
jgi:putative oxidoreductase